jgi:putative membrane protein
MAEWATADHRLALQSRLETLVRANRFTIAVVFPVVGAVLFVAGAEGWLPASLSFNPALLLAGVLVMRLPLVAGLLPVVGRRGAVALLAIAGYAYAIEYVGLATGWPYGEFHYAVELGPMVAGVPTGLPVFFLPLVVNGYLLVLLLAGDRSIAIPVRVASALAVVLLVDLVLDPAAVSLGLWQYGTPGAYYGVPASNYAGWVLSGLIAVGLLEVGFDHRQLVDRLQRCEFILDDLVSFVVLWGAVNAYFGNWIPVLLAALLSLGLFRTDRFDFAVRMRAPSGLR